MHVTCPHAIGVFMKNFKIGKLIFLVKLNFIRNYQNLITEKFYFINLILINPGINQSNETINSIMKERLLPKFKEIRKHFHLTCDFHVNSYTHVHNIMYAKLLNSRDKKIDETVSKKKISYFISFLIYVKYRFYSQYKKFLASTINCNAHKQHAWNNKTQL